MTTIKITRIAKVTTRITSKRKGLVEEETKDRKISKKELVSMRKLAGSKGKEIKINKDLRETRQTVEIAIKIKNLLSSEFNHQWDNLNKSKLTIRINATTLTLQISRINKSKS